MKVVCVAVPRETVGESGVCCSPVVHTHVVGIVTLIIFTVALFVQGRQQEWTNRLDFLWKIQVL